MACPAQHHTSCSTLKCYFYAAGFAIGAAAFGYFVRVCVSKNQYGAPETPGIYKLGSKWRRASLELV
ncbi:hypothetical protein ANCCAN_29898 [Ancylostoma caninum]|uniref:Uncharacterized protein n=1 Tax=Ancylostoma caninum TaxID=29170 RepID=A0A368F0D3_ANCCA|nr:hypothetical protein ANCCAN_29898 [Ancylostoma caninum]